MEFTCSVIVNLPIEKVVSLYDDDANLSKWQDGFISKQLISGEAGKEGSKSKITFNNRGRQMELEETILRKNLPAEITAFYHHVHMDNSLTTRFTALSPDQTRVDMETTYSKFNHIIPKLMAWLMPGMFTKQVQKWLNRFKTFAEKAK